MNISGEPLDPKMHEKFLKQQDVMGDSAPRMIKLREAIEDNRGLVAEIWKRKAPVEESAGGEGGADGDGTGGGGGSLGSRDAIYRRLQEAADQLERLEPHSPVPFLVRKAVAFGSLPFPDLLKALIRNPDVLAELGRELGIKSEG